MHTCSQSDACVMGSIRYTCIHVARVMLVSWAYMIIPRHFAL